MRDWQIKTGNAKRAKGIGELIYMFLVIGVIVLFSQTSFRWKGYYEEHTYTPTVHHVDRYCEIDNEWVEVDRYSLNLLFNDWYRIDGERTYSQGRDLTCKTDRWTEELDPVTEMRYNLGMRDILFFWKDFNE